MSIKTRLLLSYIAMIIVPVVLFALCASALASVFLKDATGAGNGEAPAFWHASSERDELFAGLKFMARNAPDRFADAAFLERVDAQLNGLDSGLVLVKGAHVAFVSPLVQGFDDADLYEQLQHLRTDWGRRWPNAGIAGRFTVESSDFTFGDGTAGTVYVLSHLSPLSGGFRMFFPLLILSLLVIIALTNGLLTYLVSRSIVRPLAALKKAAEQIKEGNLEHEAALKRKDEIGQLAAAFEDMRRRLQESVRLQMQYEENRKQLISNISHDLKTPITGLKACVEGIRDGIADTDAKREKYMGMIAKKTEEMDSLIDELFLFSKLDLKRLPFHFESVDMVLYLRDFIEDLRCDPRMKEVSLDFSFAGGGPVHAMVDREKLHRVIRNIVDNSLKYMDKERKEIRIELLDGAREMEILIRDNGPGIKHAALPHVFDRFYRADPSRNTATGGSGLGLAIVKQIVEEHGGRVRAESRVGEGTDIWIALPRIEHGGGRP